MGGTGQYNAGEVIPDQEQKKLQVVVIGASAGGLKALAEFFSHIDGQINVAFFIVIHLSSKSVGDFLLFKLQPLTTLHCKLAEDGEAIQPQTIYIAPPDRHLLVKKDKVLLGYGPVENRWRPSVNVLFRSAAAAYGSQLTGVVLTGMLDDGVSGMSAIHKSSGLCIVQDPNEAEFPDMPLAVLNQVKVDHCLPLMEIAAIVNKNAGTERPEVKIPSEVIIEAGISEKLATAIKDVAKLGDHSVFSCPQCGGGLWEITDGYMHRYRCHIGHAFSEEDLRVRQAEAYESTLWVALRIMEERMSLMLKLSEQHRKKGLNSTALTYEQKTTELEEHIGRIKELLYSVIKA